MMQRHHNNNQQQEQEQEQEQGVQMIMNPLLNITTERIQKYLDENKDLIMAILENQNHGKFAECASFQAQLQHNLMFLAKIADAQPTASQAPPLPLAPVQQEQSLQPSQVAISQQPLYFPQKVPFQFNDQQQGTRGAMRMRPGAPDGGPGMA